MRKALSVALWGMATLPLVVKANSFGPPTGSTGVPGEQTCTAANCHVGTLNPSGGSVAVTFPGGLTYTPGTRQTLTVTVNDPTAQGYGFQLTIRLASNSKTQAGSLTATGSSVVVLCSSGDFTRESQKGASCPANQPIESAEHTEPLPRARGNSWTVQWDPPATDQGNIIVYVAGNGANLNGQNTGDRIFTANYTLAPAGAAPKPAISEGGIVTAGAFGASTTVASGSWIEIFGSNFSSTTGDWGNGFQGDNAPTTTNGVSVTIGGKPAFVSFVSPGQINAQVPGDLGAGPTTVVVRNAGGESDPRTITVAARSPGLLSPPVFRVNNSQYLVALHGDGAFVGPANFITGVNSRPARPGDVILLYGVGFGAVSPANPPGVITRALNSLPNFTIRFGDAQVAPAGVLYAGLAPNFVGLYQFNITVPPGITGNTVPVTVTVDGVTLTQTLVTAIQP
jgi:uncharacterized protein (TIGR03437 family)